MSSHPKDGEDILFYTPFSFAFSMVLVRTRSQVLYMAARFPLIAGPSGCGKTQFCIMLSALCAMPKSYGGLDGAVIYIDTESAFTAGRLMEIASTKFPDYFQEESKLVKLAGRVFVYVISTCSSMIQRLQCLEDDIITQGVKLVIVDSIASLVRKEYSSHAGRNLAERTNFLTKQAAILKYLAETFSIPVVVTNQITTHFQKTKGAMEQKTACQTLDNDGAYVTAALGNTWSHSVNTRLIVQYLGDKRRQILVAKSPVAPFTVFTYTIQASGIQMEEGGSDHYAGTDPGTQQILVRSSMPNPALML